MTTMVDVDGKEIEDPVSLRPIPVEYAVELDLQYYDVRMLARVVHFGHPYVPHNRRTLRFDELAYISSFSKYNRPLSRCGAYRRNAGSYRDLYLARKPRWTHVARWIEVDRRAFCTDALLAAYDVLLENSAVRAHLRRIVGGKYDDVFDDALYAIGWFMADASFGARPSDKRERRAVLRTVWDAVLDGLLLQAHDAEWE
jgi:hypothetical protein